MKKLWVLLVALLLAFPFSAAAVQPPVPQAPANDAIQSNDVSAPAGADTAGGVESELAMAKTNPGIASLEDISILGLRRRNYRSTLTIEQQLGDASGSSAYSQYFGPPYYNTYMASYSSDKLRVYVRVDVPPTPMPAKGYPVIIFSHGWVGASGAPSYKFNYAAKSYYGDMLDAWTKAGYIVLMPGFRGHGTVNGIPAQGIEYVKAYDNGSYLSPIFYAIDILNLLQGVGTLDQVDWSKWGFGSAGAVRVDTSRIFLTGHSQGGDAALTALVVSSAPHLTNTFSAASIWSGCFEGRVEQGAFYGPQENALATKTDPAYFPHMPSWWDDSWYWQTIEEAIARKKQQMYDTVRTYVADQKNADAATNSLLDVMSTLDAYKRPEYVKAPLDLHFSDMDHYSIPAWNANLIRAIRAVGGKATGYLYPGNSHELQTAAGWSPDGSVAGRQMAIERTITLFNSAP